ncbi:MAG: hypothetical protein SGI77_02820, partial [Pirellulaceae bacterium]|nr:hypothetical protein [Pirellulaceae bacterium]
WFLQSLSFVFFMDFTAKIDCGSRKPPTVSAEEPELLWQSACFRIELFCCMFYLKQFMLTQHLDRVFHLDSDCILLDNIGRLLSLSLPDVVARNGIAYSKNKSDNPWHMAGCVHNALLTLDFCEAFIQLCFDVYENRSKFHWVEPKIRWHIENKIGGGICDMTLYYLLFTEGLLEVVDLNDIVIVDGERCVFDHNINISYGYLGDETFVMSKNVKKIIMESGKFYAFDKNGSAIRLLSIHFSGSEAKSLLRDAYKLIFGQTG